MTTSIIIAGPRGKMGSEAINMVLEEKEFSLVACLDHKYAGKSIADIEGLPDIDVPIYTDPERCFQEKQADILIDLTVPGVGYEHTEIALNHGIRPVVGTSGFTNEQIDRLSEVAKETKTGCIIAPNFAIGAVLMMQFAKMAAAYLPDVEIIEKHHDQKVDAPSGTAVKTADMIKETRKSKKQGHPEEKENMSGARGAEDDGIHIHSVRLPGLVAHQEVIFGGPGQMLTITHDSLERKSFMSGIKLAIEHVKNMDELVYGLEKIMIQQ
ncbi:4-hydroxy-tetrahydrodipicolinate reductase [Virgibacillus halophilus]|uniref:4-hydroxy-tetrahydrodipicolinate reductase n=1 Tax=Tigheibacillus halophilus TaxID=361280 RepID=A0ABU5CB65_9BACI|nr:4-hydroxy-tetrahydrodipicolinate reductase [Virgibacillus halophilus]